MERFTQLFANGKKVHYERKPSDELTGYLLRLQSFKDSESGQVSQPRDLVDFGTYSVTIQSS